VRPSSDTDAQEIAALRARLQTLERENTRLLEDERARLQETKALAAIGRLLSERLEPDVVGLRIAENLSALLGGRSSVVYRLDPNSTTLMALAVAQGANPAAGWRAVHEPGAGAIGLAIRERRTISTPDVLGDSRIEISPALRAHLAEGQDRAVLAVPLLTQDRLIGVLAVRNVTGSVFDSRAVQLAEALADQAALTLEHARLFADEERRRREAEVLAELAQTIGATLDLETVLRRVTEAAQELCRSDGAVIGLRMPDSDSVLLRYWTAPWYEAVGETPVVEPGKGLGGSVLAERRPMRTTDYLVDPRLSRHYLERIRRVGIHAEMAVPVLIEERIEGLLYVDNRSSRAFTDQDEAILVRLAAQAALAIRNAQLFADEQLARGTAERLVRALGESQERFQFVARATNDAVWDWDLLADARWWNEGVNTIFGYTPEQVAPDASWWYENIHPEDRDRIVTDIHAAIDRGAESWSAEYRYRKADGSHADVYDRGYVLHDGEGKPVRMIGAMMDVTRRKQLEDELRQAQKMEAVGRLAGGVAHDFNNLLTIIMGRSALLLGRLKADDPNRKSVELIQKTAGRAASLTGQLLAFSRKQVLQRRVLDLNATVAEMSDMLRRLIGEDVDLLLTLGPAAGRVNADPGQLEQALLNLAVNARDAMPSGGTLGVETDRVELGPAPPDRPEALLPGPYAVLRVMDTGVGMDAATQAHIFEPFFTTKEPGKGTGLGLSMVHGVVRQHGGAIRVRSVAGGGTTFEIYLPQVETAAPSSSTADDAGSRPATGQETILLVEDEEDVRALAREVLERQGHSVLEAGDGVQALKQYEAEGERIDLILTDVVMPRMSGRELVDRVRAMRPSMPVLYMSGYTEDAILRHGVRDSSMLLLGKPFTPADLIGKVREVLDKR
jgi:PAS domain S-box-containing protein